MIRARTFGMIGERRGEVFFLSADRSDSGTWPCLVRPGKKVKESGTEILFDDGTRGFLRRAEAGTFTIELPWPNRIEFSQWLDRLGEIPLPPYLHRDAGSRDAIDYQTIYARTPGSVAAPTAGLHFTPKLVEKLKQGGVEIVPLSLHVGLGTFAPLQQDSIDRGELHCESYTIPEATRKTIEAAKAQRRRVITVGTTSVRALESVPRHGWSGDTKIFIRPGHKFVYPDAMITNFHLPGSSLLWLVAAFAGIQNTRESYRTAIENGYRFYSYGDAMLVI